MVDSDEFYCFKKCVIFGDAQSGKTTFKALINRSTSKFMDTYIATEKPIESNKISVQLNIKNIPTLMCLNLLESRLEDTPISIDLVENLLYECQCAILLVDLTSQQSYNKIEELLNRIYSSNFITSYDYLSFIVLSVKGDLDQGVQDNAVNDLIEKFKSKNKSEIHSFKVSLKEAGKSKDLIQPLLEQIYETTNNLKNKVCLNLIKTSNKNNQSINSIKLILLGDSTVGKTALVTRHFKGDFGEACTSTYGISDECEMMKIRDEEYKLQVWDTAGQERFRCLPKRYYQNADGILLLFSFDVRSSFDNVAKWMSDIYSNSDQKNTLVYLIGNKCDIENRQVTRQEAEQSAKEKNIQYFEISCKYNLNVDEVFAKMVLNCYSKANKITDVFNLSGKKKKSNEQGSCCLKKN